MTKAIRDLDPDDLDTALMLFYVSPHRWTAPQIGQMLLDSGATPNARMAYKDMARMFGYAIVHALLHDRLVESARPTWRFQITDRGRAAAERLLADDPDLRAAFFD